MTSSLVGSEMCIRDRARAAGVSQMTPTRMEVSRAVWHGNSGECREDMEAVSYTHLTLPTICSV
eukprot:9079545-Prorocentrum_lima.AAC.1